MHALLEEMESADPVGPPLEEGTCFVCRRSWCRRRVVKLLAGACEPRRRARRDLLCCASVWHVW